MKKRIFLSLAAVVAIALGVVGFSAFEAHIINVTATIENALSVPLKAIAFGTVFPQEQLDENFDIAMSASFLTETDADGVEYVIKQKPKCILSAALEPGYSGEVLYGLVTQNQAGEFVCADADYEIMPFLCPYLSKHDGDPLDQNDYELDAFHGPITAWTNTDSTAWAVNGKLAKSESDTADIWTIDLKVPCFAGQCDQGWAKYVTDINPLADPSAYIQPTDNEHKEFGCDLWMEVTGINRIPTEKYNKSLTLENKDADYNWMITQDQYKATMLYNSSGLSFDFKVTGKVMGPGAYYLIYYADPWPGSNPGAKIADITADANGDFSVEGSVNLGIDLPHVNDYNHPSNINNDPNETDGAKIWIVPASDYTPNSMTTWNPTMYLYEYNKIYFDDTDA